MPRRSISLSVAPAAGWFKGRVAASAAAVTSLGLASVACYVVWAHHHEYTTERLAVLRELRARGVALEGRGDEGLS